MSDWANESADQCKLHMWHPLKLHRSKTTFVVEKLKKLLNKISDEPAINEAVVGSPATVVDLDAGSSEDAHENDEAVPPQRGAHRLSAGSIKRPAAQSDFKIVVRRQESYIMHDGQHLCLRTGRQHQNHILIVQQVFESLCD